MKALSFDDISLVPRYNNIVSRKNVDTSVQFGDIRLRIPVFSANMDTITGVTMARKMYELGGMGFLHRFCSIENQVTMYKQIQFGPTSQSSARPTICDTVISLGVNEQLGRFDALYQAGARYFCVDVAHGHSKSVGQMIEQMRRAYSDIFIVAGNVCHAAGAEYLADKGADAIKVGIGSGSACSTRIKTGFGVPQFSAIKDCRRVNCFLIADGGIRTPGDAVKAFAAGADAVMLGGMLSGSDETPGEIICDDEKSYKIFRGMASQEAQNDFMGSMAEWKTAEGVQINVEEKGPVANVIADLMGGIRSGMTYCGANNLKQIRERAEWVEVSSAGHYEGTPHGRS